MKRKELRGLQLRRLQAQLVRVYENSSFYRLRFDDVKFDPRTVHSLEDFAARAPFIEKADLIRDQEAHPPLGSRVCVELNDIARLEITSGTTGLGQEVYTLTWRDMETVGAQAGYMFAVQGVRPGDRVAVTLPLGYLQGPWGGDWAARSMGCAIYHLGLAPDSVTKLRYLQRFGVKAVYTPTPTYLMRLTAVAQEIGLVPRSDLPSLSVAWLAGEPYPIEWAARMEEFWDIRLCESYGSTQGAFAGSCEYGVAPDGERGYLHNMDWVCLMEVLDPETGESVAPGEVGEAVITNLTRQASPVIRFRTGDRVRLLPHDGCRCGRETVAVEAGTVARLDGMMKIKGMNIWPSAVDSIVLGDDRVEEYVGEIGVDRGGHERVCLRVAFRQTVPTASRNSALIELTRKLKAATNVLMEVEEVPSEDLPTFEYKAKRWVDRRSEDLTNAAREAGR